MSEKMEKTIDATKDSVASSPYNVLTVGVLALVSLSMYRRRPRVSGLNSMDAPKFIQAALNNSLAKGLPILPFQGKVPSIGRDTFIAFNSTLIGDVKIGEKSSIWYKAVVRGDVNNILIGSNVHIQDGVIVHVAKNGLRGVPIPTIIGDNVVVGPNSLLHACTLQGRNVVGAGTQVLDGAVLEMDTVITAGALVGPGKLVPSGQMWGGVPARFIRVLTAEEIAAIPGTVGDIGALARVHAIENDKTIQQQIDDGRIRDYKEEHDTEEYAPCVNSRTIHDPVPSTRIY